MAYNDNRRFTPNNPNGGSFTPTGKIMCDCIIIKFQGDTNSYLLNIPYRSSYEKIEEFIKVKCIQLNLPLERIYYSGCNLVGPKEILNTENDIWLSLKTKAEVRGNMMAGGIKGAAK